MPNVLKYTTGSEPSNTVKKGNFYIGNNTADYGSSFYTGVNPPSGGYTIYLNKASNGPSILTVSNDAELISVTNQIANTNYTTVTQCLSYYADQTDKVITNLNYPTTFPYIVMEELLCYYDAHINDSYPTTGTVWYDISGNGNNISMNGSNPTYSTINGVKCFKTDSSIGQGFSSTLKGGRLPTQNATLESWVYANPTNLTGADRGCIILLAGSSVYQSWNLDNNNLSNYWYNHSPEGYFEPGTALTRQVWVNLISVWNYSSSTLKQYVNGSLVATHTTQGTQSTGNYLQIGYEGCCGDRNFPGYIGVIRIYSKPLSGTEVLKNYNAQKSRFGL